MDTIFFLSSFAHVDFSATQNADHLLSNSDILDFFLCVAAKKQQTHCSVHFDKRVVGQNKKKMMTVGQQMNKNDNNNSNNTMTTMAKVAGTTTTTPMCIMFRHARRRNYFHVQHGQQVLSEPHKYNVRLCGIDTSKNASYSFELLVRRDDNSIEYLPLGMTVEKQIIVRGAPQDTVDVRVAFAVQSKMYNDAKFFVWAKNQQSVVLCQTNEFVLVRKRSGIEEEE